MRALIISCVALLGATYTASAQSAQAYYPWCSVDPVNAAQSCYYKSLEQCRMTMSGIGGTCMQNPYYRMSR